jgi:hypothetical protein
MIINSPSWPPPSSGKGRMIYLPLKLLTRNLRDASVLADRTIYLILKLLRVNPPVYRYPCEFTLLIGEAKGNVEKGKNYHILTFLVLFSDSREYDGMLPYPISAYRKIK